MTTRYGTSSSSRRRKPFDFRVGIVGCGRIASSHIKSVMKYVPSDRIALCDLNRHRMKWQADTHGLRHRYRELSSMLRGFSPEIVHVLTPPSTHRHIAVSVMQAGAHPLIEKPMCLSPREGREILDAASRTGRIPCVNQFMPFDPLLDRAKRMIESTRFGQLVHCSIRDFRNYHQRKRNGSIPAWLRHLPGELLFDILPHHLSILNTLLPNARLDQACCQRDRNDIAQMLCVFVSPSGKGLIDIRLDAAHNAPYHIVLEGTRGLVEVDFGAYDLVFRKRNQFRGVTEEAYQQAVTAKSLLKAGGRLFTRFFAGLRTETGMDRLIGRYYRAVRDRTPAPVPGIQGHDTICQVHELFRRSGLPFEESRAPARANATTGLADSDVLVTGGTGWIGRALVAGLQRSGYRVRVLHRPRPSRGGHRTDLQALFPEPVQAVEGDITDRSLVETACRGIHTVYHLAAATSGDWLNHIDATVLGTQNIVEALEKTGCNRLVHVSTIALLHRNRYPQDGLIDETFPLEEHPLWRDPYCYAKLEAEHMVRAFGSRHPLKATVILRPGLVYGPGKIPVLNQAKRCGALHVFKGSPRRRLPLTYIDHLVDALLLSSETRESGTFNVIDDEAVTVKEWVRTYESLTGVRLRACYVPVSVYEFLFRPLEAIFKLTGKDTPPLVYPLRGLARSVTHSNEKLKRRLHWKPAVRFRDGLERSLRKTRGAATA